MNEDQEVQVDDSVETSEAEVEEVEIVDDTPEEDRGRPRRANNSEPEIPDDQEIEKYSGNVQSRIKKLKFEYHEERRAKEEAERIRETAIEDLKRLHEENQKLKETLSKGEGALVNQAKHRVEAELQKAKSNYKQAYEAGDSDAMVDANEQMARLAKRLSMIHINLNQCHSRRLSIRKNMRLHNSLLNWTQEHNSGSRKIVIGLKMICR